MHIHKLGRGGFNRCVVHWRYSCKIVWSSSNPLRRFAASCCALDRYSSMNFAWKLSDPMGEPRTRSQFTSSCICEFLFEYFVIALVRVVPLFGWCCRSCGSIDWPEVDVMMRVLSVFITAPSGTP